MANITIPTTFMDKKGFSHKVSKHNTNLADYLLVVNDCYESGTSYFLGLILPGGEILRLEVQVYGTERHILRYVTVVAEGREINGYHEHDIEEFRKYSEFGLFETLCTPCDGNEAVY